MALQQYSKIGNQTIFAQPQGSQYGSSDLKQTIARENQIMKPYSFQGNVGGYNLNKLAPGTSYLSKATGKQEILPSTFATEEQMKDFWNSQTLNRDVTKPTAEFTSPIAKFYDKEGKEIPIYGTPTEANIYFRQQGLSESPLKKPTSVVTSDQARQDYNKTLLNYQDLINQMQQRQQEDFTKKQQEQTKKTFATLESEMAGQGIPSDFATQYQTAQKYGIQNYIGTPEQKQQLITSLQATKKSLEDKLLEASKNVGQTQGATGIQTEQPDQYSAQAENIRNLSNQFSQAQAGILNQISQNYFDMQKELESVRNGNFPLSQADQMILNEIQKATQRLVQQQIQTNLNYQKGIETFGAASGVQRYMPDRFSGMVQAAVSDGITKIQDIESKGALTLAEIQKGIDDKNYKLVSDKFNALQGLLNSKTTILGNIQNAVLGTEKDLMNFNYKATQDAISNKLQSARLTLDEKKQVLDEAYRQKSLSQDYYFKNLDYLQKQQQLDQGKYTMTTDAFGNPVAFNSKTGKFEYNVSGLPSGQTGLAAPENLAYKDATINAVIGLPEKTVALVKQEVNSEVANGNYEKAKETIVRAASQSLPIDQRNQVLARLQAIDNLNNIKSLLNVYIQKTGDTNILRGTIESAANMIGTTSDPKIAQISNQIKQTLQVYRKNMTGVAFSPAEAKEYSKIFPDISNISSLNNTKIDSLIDVMNRNQKTVIGFQIGQSNYDDIFGENAQPNTLDELYTKHPEIRGSIETMLKDNPNLSDNDILKIILPTLYKKQ